MSGLTLKCISASENEFFAEDYIVTVTPSFDHPPLKFISGTYGKFDAGIPCQVPLWLAITLYKKGMCSIQIPEWMELATLEASVNNEKSHKILGDIPFHYIEIAQMLLNNCRDLDKNRDRIAVLLQDLENIRMDRIRSGIMNIADSVSKSESIISAALNNVSSMEIYTIKRFFLSSMDVFYWLCPPEHVDQDHDNEEQQANQGSNKKLRRFRNTN